MALDPRQKAEAICKAIADRRGMEIVLMAMEGVTTICDYFVICHGRSSRHIEAIAEEIQDQLEAHDIYHSHKEGSRDSDWIVMDYMHVVVHIFSVENRETYALERLWSDAQVVARYAGEPFDEE